MSHVASGIKGKEGREGKQAIGHEKESLYLYTTFKRHGSGVGVNGLVGQTDVTEDKAV